MWVWMTIYNWGQKSWLIHYAVFNFLSPCTHRMWLWVKNLTDTTRLEDLPQFLTLCFAFFFFYIRLNQITWSSGVGYNGNLEIYCLNWGVYMILGHLLGSKGWFCQAEKDTYDFLFSITPGLEFKHQPCYVTLSPDIILFSINELI